MPRQGQATDDGDGLRGWSTDGAARFDRLGSDSDLAKLRRIDDQFCVRAQ